jgi:hypothetical protein
MRLRVKPKQAQHCRQRPLGKPGQIDRVGGGSQRSFEQSESRVNAEREHEKDEAQSDLVHAADQLAKHHGIGRRKIQMDVYFVSKMGMPNGMPTTLHFVKKKLTRPGSISRIKERDSRSRTTPGMKNAVSKESCNQSSVNVEKK